MGWIADLLKEIPSAARYKAELEEMEKENTGLKSENAVLKSQVVDLRQEIQRRDDVVQKEKSHKVLLDDVQVKILSFLWNQPNKTAEEISESLKIDLEAIKFHLSELGSLNMAQSAEFYDSYPPYQVWLLDQEGRGYLIKHKTS